MPAICDDVEIRNYQEAGYSSNTRMLVSWLVSLHRHIACFLLAHPEASTAGYFVPHAGNKTKYLLTTTKHCTFWRPLQHVVSSRVSSTSQPDNIVAQF